MYIVQSNSVIVFEYIIYDLKLPSETEKLQAEIILKNKQVNKGDKLVRNM